MSHALRPLLFLTVLVLPACAPPRDQAKAQAALLRDTIAARATSEREALTPLLAGWLAARKDAALAQWKLSVAETRSQVLLTIDDRREALHAKIGADLRQAIEGPLTALDAKIAAAGPREAREHQGVKAAIMITAQRTYDEATDHVDRRLKELRTAQLAALDAAQPPEALTTWNTDAEAARILTDLGPDAQLQAVAEGLTALQRFLDAPEATTLVVQGLIPDRPVWAGLRQRLGERADQLAGQVRSDAQARLGSLLSGFTAQVAALTLPHP